ncbi:hypothetical protein AB0L00_22120 [Actinoallomurus sp. NPDC052308]|uniref:hypothetical protein n=1 Tax=Actinoallomurus sp. NPDC052308 TaxID=3155530 RepID=UPI00341FCE24
MPINCTVSVVDVNGRPLAGASVSLGAARGVTDAAGTWTTVIADPGAPITLEVDDSYHVKEVCAFEGDPRTAMWNNALVSRTINGADLLLSVRLGRMDTSPTTSRSDAELAALMTTKARDPGAVLLWKPPRFPNVLSYRTQWNDQREVRVPRPQLLPSTAVPPGTKGWNRLQSDPAVADLAAFGRFYWLEYSPRPSRPRWVVAVWSPNLPDERPPATLDYVVFYSPTTANEEYTAATYPYGLVYAAAPFQKYLELAKKYLLDEFFFAYEMVAQRDRAVLVMPIGDAGDIGPWASGEGLLRLLREVGLFLHRQCRTSRLGLRPPTASPVELAGPNMRGATVPVVAGSFGDAPAVGKVAVAGFSTGIGPVKGIMPDGGWNTSLGSVLWGVPAGNGADPRRLWRESWRELWDLDGFHPATGGWPTYLDLLQTWARANESRVVRSYHTSGRVPPDPRKDPHPVWKYLRGPGLDIDLSLPAVAGIGRAQQLQNARWTSVTMDDSYLDGGSVDLPGWLDPHHTTPRVGFPHALKITTVGR